MIKLNDDLIRYMMDDEPIGIPIEHLRGFVKATPEARLKWLEDAQEFVKKAVPPEKLERWKQLKNSKL